MLPGFLPFERLPKELIVYAMQFCCFTDILRFSATCRKYFYLVHNTTSLQLQIELEANRLQTASNHTPVGQQQLLEALKGYRDNWLDLSLVQGQTIVRAPNGELFTLWELRGGILANGYSTLEFRDLQANALQLVSLGDPLSRWNLTFQEYFDELTMDPSQDLLVLTTVDQTNSNMLSVRFHSLRTGLAHPLAMRPVVLLQLEFSVTPYPTYSTICLYIVDELLLLSLVCNEFVEPSNGVFCEVLVLNWRTGELLNRMGKCEGFCSAICLDRDRLAVFFVQTISSAMPPSSMSLLLYDDIRTPRAACLPQSEAVCCISAYSPLRSVLSLGFPEFNPGAVIVLPDFLVRSEPLPSDSKHSGPKFIPDPLYRTLCLTMRLADEVDHANVVVFIDVQRLLHYLSQRSTRSLLWHEWGKKPHDGLSFSIRPVTGYRVCADHDLSCQNIFRINLRNS
ncbi:hypothetical protein FRC12_008208 [Ceratobasidium sp. 428]|nr:hypothetical protein FRC12_008208 [Ceratobasidium sp. 428]